MSDWEDEAWRRAALRIAEELDRAILGPSDAEIVAEIVEEFLASLTEEPDV